MCDAADVDALEAVNVPWLCHCLFGLHAVVFVLLLLLK